MKKLLFFLALFPVLAWGQQVINLDPSSLGALNALLLLDQDIIWVSSGNTTGIETGTMIYPYNTIQEGLDAAAAGNVVLVLAGTYSEHLSMATNNVRLMTLEGQTVSVELLQSSNRGLIITGDSVIIGGGSGMGFTFTADGARMIELAANEVDCEISYNTIIVDAGGTIGINVGAAGATRLKVKNNLFKVASGQGGFYATKNLIDCDISGNEFIGGSQASGYAIQMSGFYGGVIKDNYIHADTTDGVKGFASGIFPHTVTSDPHASDSLEIFNNIVQDCANGIRLGHTSMTANMTALFVYGNTIQHCVDGIEIANDAQVVLATYDIYDNTFSDNTNHINSASTTAPNVGLNTFDGLVAINSFNPAVDLYVDGTIQVTDSMIIDYTASDNVLVLTPTSTGKVDTLETTDLATEDFTTTGNWVFDTVEVTGMLYRDERTYIFEGFEDSTISVDMTQNVYAQITNASHTLWTVIDNNDITESGDTIIIATAGDYWGTYAITFTGDVATFRFRVYNVTDGTEEGLAVHSTGWGAGNYTVVTKPVYLKDCSAGDRFVFQFANLTNNDDATLNDGAIMLKFFKK